MTRRGLARLIAFAGGVVLLAGWWLADTGRGSALDAFLLGVATIGHFVAVIGWWLAPWAPRWLVAGYGLVLASSGLGFMISAPAAIGGAGLTLVAMATAGVLTIIAAIVHR